MRLQYYGNDYTPILNNNSFANITAGFGANAKSLYNGNISSMAVNIPKLGNALVYAYTYDQLNRITAMDAWGGLNNANNQFTPISLNGAYQERITYDPNGNILTYKRNGDKAGAQQKMDELTYDIENNSNRLKWVKDAAPDANYTEDIDNQSANNYAYDAIGNLIQDTKEGITKINWTVYGKIESIEKSDGTTIRYSYDATGNRISKTVTKAGATNTTFYVRDAQGNVMSIYTTDASINSGHFTQSELHLYGSSRLGIYNLNKDLTITPPAATNLGNGNSGGFGIFERGKKFFELSNHLGNVLATVSDEKIGVDADNDGTIDYYTADVVSAQDYYPFGMTMPARTFSMGGPWRHRYGFNGKELDNEVVQYDYGFRIYDPRLGRFKSVDPLFQSYPWFSPYQFAGNSPILNIDLDGLENKPTQPNTQPQNPDERFKELYEKFKEVKPYIKDATKLAKVSWQFQAGVYAAKAITEGKILDIKSKIRTNNKELAKLTQELNADENGNQTKSDFKGYGEGSMGGGGASGTWEEAPNAKPRVKTAAEIKREQRQKKIEALKKANESLEWDKQKYETVREGLNEFTMFGDVRDEVMDILKVVKDPTPENIKKYLEDKATQYVKDRLLDGLTKDKAKEKNKSSSKKSSNSSNTP